MATPVLPRVHLLAICDEIQEHEDGVLSYDLFGVRTHIQASTFPYQHPQLCVYVQATGYEGLARCHVAIEQASTDKEVFTSADMEFAFTGPLEFLHGYFRVDDCDFPEAGVYYIQVFFDNKLCGERALILLERETRHNGQA